MSSIKCPQCGLTNWADADLCKRCGFELHANTSHGADWRPGDNIAQGYTPQYYPAPQNLRVKAGLAIASMVLGIVALVTCGLGILFAPLGLILGIVSLRKANKNAHLYGGKGFAIAGIATSIVSLFVVVPLIAAIAIPNILAARRVAYETSAMKNVAALAAAEQRYMISSASGQCGDLATLGSKSLIDPLLAKGEKSGYRYTTLDEVGEKAACGIQATPISNDGSRSYYFSTADGIMRAAGKSGRPADRNDPPLGSDLQRSYR